MHLAINLRFFVDFAGPAALSIRIIVYDKPGAIGPATVAKTFSKPHESAEVGQRYSDTGRAEAGSKNYYRVRDDYGEISEGATRAHYVLAENHTEYIIKGSFFCPEHPYVAANEWISAKVAEQLQLPVLDHRPIEMDGRVYFGSAWMQKQSFHPNMTPGLFNRCENKPRLYDIVVLDVYIMNIDRHERNLVAKSLGRTPGGTNDRIGMLLNDHSHCLVLPNTKPHQLSMKLDSPPGNFVRLDFLRNSVRSVSALRDSIARVEGIDDRWIADMVNCTPVEFLPTDERQDFIEFLCERRWRLRPCFRDNRVTFPKLGPGAL